jgi:oligopeptidase A
MPGDVLIYYVTRAPLPDALFEKLTAARTFRSGSLMLRQLTFALLDLELHHRYDPDGPESPFDVQQRLAARTSVLPPLPDDRFLCGFGHIFAGGYAAATQLQVGGGAVGRRLRRVRGGGAR